MHFPLIMKINNCMAGSYMQLCQSFSPRLINWFTQKAAQYADNSHLQQTGIYDIQLDNWYTFEAIYFLF